MTDKIEQCPFCKVQLEYPLHFIRCALNTLVDPVNHQNNLAKNTKMKYTSNSNTNYLSKRDTTKSEYNNYVRIFTDGSLDPKNVKQRCGTGTMIVQVNGDTTEYSEVTKYHYQSIFRVELLTVVNAMLYRCLNPKSTIIFTDCQEVVNVLQTLNTGDYYLCKTVQCNWDILSRVHGYLSQQIKVLKITAHSIDIYNNRVDYLANYSRLHYQANDDHYLQIEKEILPPIIFYKIDINYHKTFKNDLIKTFEDIELYVDVLLRLINTYIEKSKQI